MLTYKSTLIKLEAIHCKVISGGLIAAGTGARIRKIGTYAPVRASERPVSSRRFPR